MSLEGQQIHRYRILRLLGSGGMGDVYLAEDPRIEQQVAIKVIRAETSPYPDTHATQEAARLFQREARAIVKLDHPHILPLYDYGEERLGNMTIIYLVMPYRAEGSLSDWLRQRGRAGLLAPQDVAHIVGQAADALQHAHDRQIIHQDVKPSNFLLRQRQETPTRPDLLLADFGIAKFTTATTAMSHTIRGTPTYMAPEQWEGQPVPATDQYALAVMAYELLTGRSPFQGGERQVMYQHLMVLPTPPSTVNPRLSKDIDTVLLHALAKKPEERFKSVQAFANAFQQAVQDMPAADAPARPAAPPTPASANSDDIRAVLAISTAEAQAGTTRTLTLPRGRQVTVSVPAGVRDGQIVRLEGQGETSPGGGPAGALILSILVTTAEESPSLSTASAAVAENTVLSANPTAPTGAPTVGNTGQQPSVSSTAHPEMTTPPSSLVGPTQAAVSASQVSFPTTQQSLPVRPSVEWSADRSSQVSGPVTAQPAQRGISRRTVVVGLAGLVVVGVAGGGLLWLGRSQQPTALPPSMPTASPAPPPVGSTLYTYRGHFSAVDAVAWSPDGRRIASGSQDNRVQVWDAADGGHVYTYRGHSNGVFAVGWSPDGRRIASASTDYTVQVWDATDGGNVYTYRGHSGGVFAVAWSPDSKRIASGSQDNTVQVWDAANGGHLFTYRRHSGSVNAVAWSPDGKRIASGSGQLQGTDHTVQVWDAADGGHVYSYRGHADAVNAVGWSPDGKRIASGSQDNTVQVWDAADGGHLFTYRGHSDIVSAVAWSPDDKRIASGGSDKTVQVWDAVNGGHAYIYHGHSALVWSMAWSPDGKRIASGSEDRTVQVWVAA